MTRDLLRDLYATAAAALLVAAAAVVGTAIEREHGTLYVDWPPLLADWGPHVGPGTPAALVVAIGVVAYGPRVAARLPWRTLLGAAWGAAMSWTWSLALIDGWQRGIAVRLTTRYEYLQVIDRFDDIPATLRDFTHHILLHSPDNWPAHVAGHPPAATVTFVLLDRAGLGGGGWAGTWCITVGASACVAVLVAVRALADEALARRAAPFLVLTPAAVWMGTSADGYFAAVAAWSVAFLALAVTGHRPRLTGFASGLLFGLTCYLSYGLTLFAVVAGAALLLGGPRRTRPLPYVLAGVTVVPLAFTLAGFHWWEAYQLLVDRYHQGAGGIRPYSYWVWANLACTVLIVGPATVAGLRRTVARLFESPARLRARSSPGVPLRVRTPDRLGASVPVVSLPRRRVVSRAGGPDFSPDLRLALLVAAAFTALLVADLSGMSKAETERIWLPFAMWLPAACASLSRPRTWLAAQAVIALLLNHLLLTGW
ncbi:hypothetical protein ACIP4U_33425 [Streptomyces caelestis]|uniref:Integral membrane protein n=1 Tax=Streptomyces caelestis TaxID=36816 RepID=A0A7W9LQB2_9ACTN|nr:hypothetical protein [Streptomyces caelestis]MBB5792235.1 hypothetical protein [Streptomyces caelestis]GGW82970.1 membrane protein [Streptomyces caelestis]